MMFLEDENVYVYDFRMLAVSFVVVVLFLKVISSTPMNQLCGNGICIGFLVAGFWFSLPYDIHMTLPPFQNSIQIHTEQVQWI